MNDQARPERETAGRANLARPRGKPFGPTFWTLFTIFFFICASLTLFLIGYLIYLAATAESPDDREARPPLSAPAPEAPPEPENSAASSFQTVPGPGKADEDIIYQDESGVWRNTGPGAGTAGQNLISQLGGLMPGAEGKPLPLSGGELAPILEIWSALGGQSSGGADLSSLLGGLTASGQDGGRPNFLTVLESLPGLIASEADESAPLNIIRGRPQSASDRPGRPAAAEITAGGSGLTLEGYERFDPATAGEIQSEWNRFEDPR